MPGSVSACLNDVLTDYRRTDPGAVGAMADNTIRCIKFLALGDGVGIPAIPIDAGRL